MTIEVLFNDASLASDTKKSSKPLPTAAELSKFATAALEESGIASATVSTILGRNGYLLRGSTRLPLLVQTETERFVIKRYDEYDPARECELIKHAKDIVPEAKFFGQEFYAEEFIDPTLATSLEHIADSGYEGLRHAVVEAGKIHAMLARKNIDYNHSHHFSEFHLLNDKAKVTDFGTARFFRREGELDYFDELLAELKSPSLQRQAFLSEIPCFSRDRPQYAETSDSLCSLSDDPVAFLNLILVMRNSAIGIKEYAERIPARTLAKYAHYDPIPSSLEAWDITMQMFPSFVKSFSEYWHKNSDA
jgi:hypothetical protein